MDKDTIKSILTSKIPISKQEGDAIKKRTVPGTFHVGGLSGNRLNSGTLRSQFIVCESKDVWQRSDEFARRTLHSDQRVFVQTGDDVWDVYSGSDLLSESLDPICIRRGARGLDSLLKGFMLELALNSSGPTQSHTQIRQLITYGAPGTGKSWKTDKYIKDNGIECFRTTFHPDSDYSTFVGAYKPTMKTLSRVVQDGTTIKHPTYAAGVEEGHKNDDKIVYEFRPQAFMKAYVAAWKNMGTPDGEDGKPKPVFLVIEEINRGNCAQIFGDIFQLLDRDENGWSSYPINADTDLAKHLKDNLPDLSALACPDKMNPDDWDKVKVGEMLALPPNLYIHATMNTSDQSLFPIDSAFKRRWDWRFIPISKPTDAGWVDRKILVGGKKFDWWDFIDIINEWILDKTKSEDKQLGYFFVKAPDATGIITGEQFANKVLFYIYNDVFKDYDLPKDVFGKENSEEKYQFKEFFNTTGDVNEAMVAEFLSHLKKGERKIGVDTVESGETPPSEEASAE